MPRERPFGGDGHLGGSNSAKQKEADTDIARRGPWLLLNDGTGHYSLAPSGLFPESVEHPDEKTGVAYDERLYRVDLNADGQNEIVVSRLFPTLNNIEQVSAFTPKGKRKGFVKWKSIGKKWLPRCALDGQAQGDCGGHAAHLGFGDLNGDGAAEILTVAGTADHLYLNNGKGKVKTDITHLMATLYENSAGRKDVIVSAAIADMDGDGDDDIWGLISPPRPPATPAAAAFRTSASSPGSCGTRGSGRTRPG